MATATNKIKAIIKAEADKMNFAIGSCNVRSEIKIQCHMYDGRKVPYTVGDKMGGLTITYLHATESGSFTALLKK